MLFPIYEKFGLLPSWALGSLLVFARYALFAGISFLVFYLIWKKNWLPFRIQERFPPWRKIRHELIHSLATAGVFAALGIGIYFLYRAGYTRLYTEIETYGWAYLLFSFFLLTVIHDTYFYWMHRLMHHPRLFGLLHKVHHISNNPTPWASLSFHPLEAMVEIGIVPLAVLVMPLHPLALFAFSIWSLFFNLLGHLGYELFPRGFVRHPVGKWFNTSTHHNMHHSRSNCNFGLYYNFWDRLLGTNATDYEQTFDAIKSRHSPSISRAPDLQGRTQVP
ncbi:sterol desaturase family protein [Flavilitoribacter nigricans]|uniref:Sterol desaturase n=1 Tax=Flavilitoribacter nigricans (strain ATCC 23147 / DSM 23189 / NBRC 102662 / NCIMB 1420 / SS-2) TaxID=1122177 RepID=A0A2D0NDY6_FLAN2|nr:sterol desaturase family protein [Flavilitoribacter nigricans]PHN06734.1 sterol desaturase [Flavilitoribacter nigricans DSM 23189 = NBRC 102662]